MSTKKSAPTVPKEYGAMLIEQARRIGIERKELEKITGLSHVTLWRVETGHEQSSIKAANQVRQVLLERGLKIPPVPVGEDLDIDWNAQVERFGPPSTHDNVETIIRKNMIRFREEAGYDQINAADAAMISYDALRNYELGNGEPSNAELKQLAEIYGHKPGDFFEVQPPPANLDDVPWIHFRVRPGYELTDDDWAEIRGVLRRIEDRFKSAKKAQIESFKRAKARRRKPTGTDSP